MKVVGIDPGVKNIGVAEFELRPRRGLRLLALYTLHSPCDIRNMRRIDWFAIEQPFSSTGRGMGGRNYRALCESIGALLASAGLWPAGGQQRVVRIQPKLADRRIGVRARASDTAKIQAASAALSEAVTGCSVRPSNSHEASAIAVALAAIDIIQLA